MRHSSSSSLPAFLFFFAGAFFFSALAAFGLRSFFAFGWTPSAPSSVRSGACCTTLLQKSRVGSIITCALMCAGARFFDPLEMATVAAPLTISLKNSSTATAVMDNVEGK